MTLKLKNIQDKKKQHEGKTNKYKEKKINMRINHKNTRVKNKFSRTTYFSHKNISLWHLSYLMCRNVYMFSQI
jgi:hypothetical protein